ncbi:hypothetical protein, partial [Aeromonas hydrophila]|uniref:hypothetical protein n=1 Tax=Aeromonas hydrophila TaxID=644 RepID=UPI0036DB1E39
SIAFSQALGFGSAQPINRMELACNAKYAISLRPFVAGNFLKFYPVSFHSEPPTETPLSYSDVGFSDLLPTPIMEFLKEKAIVKNIIKQNGSHFVSDELELSRSICLRFE